jgi:hypothetical protein
MFQFDEMRIFGKFIHHHQITVGVRGNRKTFNKVHGNDFPSLIWDKEWL